MSIILLPFKTNTCFYLPLHYSNKSEHAKWRNDTNYDSLEDYTPVESNITKTVESDVGTNYVRKSHKGNENVLFKLAIL